MDYALIMSAILFVLFLTTVVVLVFLSRSLKKREKEILKEKQVSYRQLYELSIVKELGERVGYSLDVEEILQIITGSLKQFIDYTAVGYVVLSRERLKINVHFSNSVAHPFFLEMKKRMLDSLGALSNKSYKDSLIEESVSGSIEMDAGPSQIGSFFNIPLVVGGKLAGVLTVAHSNIGLYKEEDMTILYKITNQASEAVSRLQKVVEREQERINKVRDEYTSMIVHELRSPLDGIRKIIELVVSGKLENQVKLKEYATMAYQSSGRMLKLINDILDLSKLEAGKFEIIKTPSNIKEAIENRISFYRVSADIAKVEINSYFDQDLPETAFFDKEAIKQVLNNLIANALRFTPAGGSITISLFLVRPDKDLPVDFKKTDMPVLPTKDDLKVNTSSICIVVSDTGSGIPQDQISNLFRPYSQMRINSGSGFGGDGDKGTGLGLSIVKGIVGSHGGIIGVVSKDGLGSSFFFTIPI